MKTSINYSDIKDRKARDVRAIKDAQNYLGAELWANLLYELGRVEERGTVKAWNEIDVAMSFVGVRGLPVHAIARKYCPTAYRAWMESGDDAVKLDDDGFPIDD